MFLAFEKKGECSQIRLKVMKSCLLIFICGKVDFSN